MCMWRNTHYDFQERIVSWSTPWGAKEECQRHQAHSTPVAAWAVLCSLAYTLTKKLRLIYNPYLFHLFLQCYIIFIVDIFMSLVRFISGYFILFVVVVLIHFSVCSLIVCKSYRFLYFVVESWEFAEVFRFICLLVEYLGSCTYRIISCENGLIYFFLFV